MKKNLGTRPWIHVNFICKSDNSSAIASADLIDTWRQLLLFLKMDKILCHYARKRTFQLYARPNRFVFIFVHFFVLENWAGTFRIVTSKFDVQKWHTTAELTYWKASGNFVFFDTYCNVPFKTKICNSNIHFYVIIGGRSSTAFNTKNGNLNWSSIQLIKKSD